MQVTRRERSATSWRPRRSSRQPRPIKKAAENTASTSSSARPTAAVAAPSYVDADLIAAAKQRTEASLMTRMTWPTWRADADKEAELAMDSLRKIFSDPSLLTMTRQALANDGHCKLNSPDALVASLAFEQVYVARLTNLVQDKGNFWGGRDAEPAAQCAWERASRLLTPEAARTLSRDGIVVIDGALTASEVAAARAEIDALDKRGELKVVEAQSKARIRNDRIGWVACSSNSTSGGGPPGLRLVGKLLRAIPAAVGQASLKVDDILVGGNA